MTSINSKKKSEKGGKVGRPRTKKQEISANIKGIVNTHDDDELLAELVYSGSELFKRVFGIFKSYKVIELCITFGPRNIFFIAQTQVGISVKFKIDCRYIDSYFCKTPVSVYVKQENLCIFTHLEKKDIYKIAFRLYNYSYTETLHIHLHDYEFDSSDDYQIKLINKGPTIDTEDNIENKDFAEVLEDETDEITIIDITTEGLAAARRATEEDASIQYVVKKSDTDANTNITTPSLRDSSMAKRLENQELETNDSKITSTQKSDNLDVNEDPDLTTYDELNQVQENYPFLNLSELDMSFRLSAKQFKKKIKDMSKFSTYLVIQRHENCELKFSFDKVETASYECVYKDPSKINLVCNTQDLIKIKVLIGYVQPFSSSIISEFITLSIYSDKKMMFSCQIEKRDSGYIGELSVLIPYEY